MRPFRSARLQRFVASLVLAALGCALAPAGLARSGDSRTAREARLDAVLAHPDAVRIALAASDAARSPEAAVGVFVDVYRAATGTTVAAETVATAVADLLLGRTIRPVPLPETRVVAAGPAPASVPTVALDGFEAGRARVRADLAPRPLPVPAPAVAPNADAARTSPTRAP